jgi:hypothetical protein
MVRTVTVFFRSEVTMNKERTVMNGQFGEHGLLNTCSAFWMENLGYSGLITLAASIE